MEISCAFSSGKQGVSETLNFLPTGRWQNNTQTPANTRKQLLRDKHDFSSGARRGAPDGVATLKVRKGAFDALKKGSGALGKRSKVVRCPLKNNMNLGS